MSHVATQMHRHATWVGTATPATRREHDALERVATEYQAIADAGTRAAAAMRAMRDLPAVPHDPAAVVSIFEQYCARDIAAACDDLGLAYQTGAGVATADGSRANALFDKACRPGSGHACFNRSVDWTKRNDAVSAERGYADACTNLAVLYVRGQEVTPDAARAVELSGRICDLGNENGRVTLGDLLRDGRGHRVDVPQAVSLYQRACDGKIAAACRRLADLLMGGARDFEPNQERALQLYRRACDGGDARAYFRMRESNAVLREESERQVAPGSASAAW